MHEDSCGILFTMYVPLANARLIGLPYNELKVTHTHTHRCIQANTNMYVDAYEPTVHFTQTHMHRNTHEYELVVLYLVPEIRAR